MKDLVIIGAGDFGREVTDIVERINAASDTQEWNLLGFIDDNKELAGKDIDGYRVIGDIDYLNTYYGEIYACCSIGVAKTRKKVIEKVTNPGVKWATIVSHGVEIYRGVEIEEGSIICGGSILAISTRVGRHVIVNLNSTLGHDDVIGDYCVINPGVNLSGKVTIGDCTDIGTGSNVIQGINIGNNTGLGAGAVVIRDVPDNCLAVGVPVETRSRK